MVLLSPGRETKPEIRELERAIGGPARVRKSGCGRTREGEVGARKGSTGIRAFG